MTLRRLYEGSPVWWQHVMTTVAGYSANRYRFGSSYWSERVRLATTAHRSLEQRREYQLEQLNLLLKSARGRSAFYSDFLSGVDLPVRRLDDLKAIPVLTKEILRQRLNDIYTISSRNAVAGHTGGTTGTSLVVRYTQDDMNRRMAMLDHFKEGHGFEHRKMRRASFTGRHMIPPGQSVRKFWRYNHASRQMLYSSMHLSEEHIPYYIRSLNRFRPHAIDGFPSAMFAVGNYLLRHGQALDFTPIALFPTAESLTPGMRSVVERAFGAPAYNQYASSEGAPFITECTSRVLHLELESGIFEVEADGSLVVTSFTTHGTPLIRYRIGDRLSGYAAETVCACGISGPTAQEILGRDTDYLLRTDGARVYSANVGNMFKNLGNSVIKAQLSQSKKGAVRANLVVDRSRWSQTQEQIFLEECRQKLGTDTHVEINYVGEIPLAASGKHRLILNSIPQQGGYEDVPADSSTIERSENE